jgi:Na+/melibiose symporter-like transporter
MIVGAIVMTRYHLTQERITEIQLELEKRRAAARAAGSAAQSAAPADRIAAPVFASER